MHRVSQKSNQGQNHDQDNPQNVEDTNRLRRRNPPRQLISEKAEERLECLVIVPQSQQVPQNAFGIKTSDTIEPRLEFLKRPLEEIRAGELDRVSKEMVTSSDGAKTRIFSIFIAIITTVGLMVVFTILVNGQSIANRFQAPADHSGFRGVVSKQVGISNRPNFRAQPGEINLFDDQISSPLMRIDKPMSTLKPRHAALDYGLQTSSGRPNKADDSVENSLSNAEHLKFMKAQEDHYNGGSIQPSASHSRRVSRSDGLDSDSDSEREQQDEDSPTGIVKDKGIKWSQLLGNDLKSDQPPDLISRQDSQQSQRLAERRNGKRKSVPQPQPDPTQANDHDDGDYDDENQPSETEQPQVPERRKFLRAGGEQSNLEGSDQGHSNANQQAQPLRQNGNQPQQEEPDSDQAREELNEEANDEMHFKRKPVDRSDSRSQEGTRKSTKNGQRSPTDEKRKLQNRRQGLSSPTRPSEYPNAQIDDPNSSSPNDSSNDPQGSEDEGEDSSEFNSDSPANRNNMQLRSRGSQKDYKDNSPAGGQYEARNNSPVDHDGSNQDNLDPDEGGNVDPGSYEDSGSSSAPSSNSEVKSSLSGADTRIRPIGKGAKPSEKKHKRNPTFFQQTDTKLKPVVPMSQIRPVPSSAPKQDKHDNSLPASWAAKLSSPRKRDSSAAYNPQNNPSHAGKYFIN